ncbi:hypothetical protein XENOCAPTIV_010032 [Xenoophorus captivus]|uniref:Uncharacterized protein n=1 Tax=Xenoophorus captivus TaxID=1517983 RepID=A0ABV0QR04_9TELE
MMPVLPSGQPMNTSVRLEGGRIGEQPVVIYHVFHTLFFGFLTLLFDGYVYGCPVRLKVKPSDWSEPQNDIGCLVSVLQDEVFMDAIRLHVHCVRRVFSRPLDDCVQMAQTEVDPSSGVARLQRTSLEISSMSLLDCWFLSKALMFFLTDDQLQIKPPDKCLPSVSLLQFYPRVLGELADLQEFYDPDMVELISWIRWLLRSSVSAGLI